MRISAHLDTTTDKKLLCSCGNPHCNGKKAWHFKKAIINVFDVIRAAGCKLCDFDVPIDINSGLRCPKYNRSVGGRPKSRHLPKHGDALDLDCPDAISFDDFAKICDEAVGDAGAVILYPKHGFIHVDMRGRRVRMTI